MNRPSANVVICGAGIAGVGAAYHLAVRRGIADILLVDRAAPLSLTSDKSFEAHRNWWPGPGDAMVRFMNRSIDLLEELYEASGRAFYMNQRGYLWTTAEPERVPELLASAEETSALGAGPLRVHGDFVGHASSLSQAAGQNPPTAGASKMHALQWGADLILDQQLIHEQFPYLATETVAVLHARRCGWFGGQGYGMVMLERARAAGVRFMSGCVEGVEVAGERVQAVRISTEQGEQRVETRCFVSAAGPYQKQIGRMLGVELPIFAELHAKVAIQDSLGVIPRDAPLTICADPVRLAWSEAEREMLGESEETAWLLEPLPPGVHTRPEGEGESQVILISWSYDTTPVEPAFPIQVAPDYYEVALRGLSVMIPGMVAYLERPPRPFIDGGYYMKTRENRPLVGPLPVEGAYIIGALSGYGLMASSAAGDLLAATIAGDELPDYAPAFRLDRYDDPAYQQMLAGWSGVGGQI